MRGRCCSKTAGPCSAVHDPTHTRRVNNGGQLSFATVYQVLQLAKGNKTADINCYNAVVKFFNGVSCEGYLWPACMLHVHAA